MACDFIHPNWGSCVASGANHEMHQFNIFENNRLVDRKFCHNDDWHPPEHKTKEAMASDLLTKTRVTREFQRELGEDAGRRNVGRSSVGHPTTAERMEGAQQAGDAMEPEFIDAAMEGGREIMRRQERMTADDLWEWLDARGHYTEHPKGMKVLLGRLIKEGTMEPVPDSDPDSHRPPKRSNQSRLLRVYRSLVVGQAAPGLRNFD